MLVYRERNGISRVALLIDGFLDLVIVVDHERTIFDVAGIDTIDDVAHIGLRDVLLGKELRHCRRDVGKERSVVVFAESPEEAVECA